MELNFNSVETIANLNASAAFQVDSGKVFKDDVDICPVIIDKKLSYIPWVEITIYHTTSLNLLRATRRSRLTLFLDKLGGVSEIKMKKIVFHFVFLSTCTNFGRLLE